MSRRPSACVPPPADYTPKPRPQNTSKHREGPGRDGHDRSSGSSSRHDNHQPLITFHNDRQQPGDFADKSMKYQPRDRFHRNDDDDYFARVQDEEEENEESEETHDEQRANSDNEDEDDDPLDAYMKSLEENTNKNKKSTKPESPSHKDGSTGNDAAHLSNPELERARGVRLDIDDTDDIEESYYKFVEEKKYQSDNQDEDEQQQLQNLIEYDKDGNVISARKVKREVEPLPPIDHSAIVYENFEKAFYQEHEEIAKLTQEQSDGLRAKLEIKVSGNSAPKPVCSFAHFKFDEKLMKVIRKSEYFQPTPIQAQAIPAALSGRNIIGIAVTGSGKTAAYLWPMIVHIMKQPRLKQGDGPIGLVLVPTRELALQVYGEAKKFSNSYKLAVVCAYGGGSKYEQSRDLEAGAEIVVATPGRMIDLIKSNVTNLRRVTYLVLDEADRFFEMGFEAQVRSICDHIRPDRQTLLFSATFKYKVEQLARTVTDDPVKIIQKTLGEANEDVTQHVIVLKEASKKWEWLLSRLVEFTSSGGVLIFVTRIVNSDELQKKLEEYGKETLLLHGDMEQSERNRAITAFKRKECDTMIATDVAARGLDISHIRTVINYDVARDIDTHIHRVGRTGRAGTKGDAFTLLSLDKDKEFAGHLVKNLESSNQEVSDDLIRLAMQSHTFRKSRDNRNRRDHRGDHKSASSSHHRTHHNHKKPFHNDGEHRSGQHHHHMGGGKHDESYNRNQHRDSSSSYRHERLSSSSNTNANYRHDGRSHSSGEAARDSSRHIDERYSNHEHEQKRPKWQ